MKYFADIVNSLSNNPLPGFEAHVKMTPSRNIKPENIINLHKDYKTGAVLVLIYTKNNSDYVVFIKRPVYAGTHSAQVSFPGGRKDETDVDYTETALRETQEEIGVDKNDVMPLRWLSSLYIPPSNFLVQPVLGICKSAPIFKIDPKEVDYIIESPLKRIFDDDVIKFTDIRASYGLVKNIPYFDIKGEIVWGATAAILNELREFLYPAKEYIR
jgi:8-oxo-dGTP pyrophosphatase MutT (NUDIX family)